MFQPLLEIINHFHRADPAMKVSIATLMDYAINRTIQEFRENPAKVFTDYQTYRQQKVARAAKQQI